MSHSDGPQPSRIVSGTVLVVLTLISWSSVPLFLRYFAPFIDGWTANGWRYAIAAIFWAPVVIVGVYKGSLPKGLWVAAIVPSVFNSVAQSLFAWTPYYIHPGLMTFLLRFQIIFITLGAYLLFPGERRLLRSRQFWIGIFVVFLGAVGVLLLGKEPPRGATALGAVLGLSSGILFAGYALSVRYFMHDVHPIVAFAAISLYTAAAMVSVMWFAGSGHGSQVFALTGPQFILLIASALIGIAFAHAMYYAGIIRLGVSVSAGIILLQPILTSTASYFLFDEQMTVAQWVCGLGSLCGAGILLAAQSRVNRPAPVDNPPEPQDDLLPVIGRV